MSESEKSYDRVDTSSKGDSLQKLKKEVAKKYLSLIDSKKEGVVWVGATLGVWLNPLQDSSIKYLLWKKEWLFPKLFNSLLKNIKKDKNVDLDLVYDRENVLDPMKNVLEKADIEQLKSLKKQIEAWKIPTELTDPSTIKTEAGVATVAASSVALANSSSIEKNKESGKRGIVLKKLDEVVAYDKTHPIKYSWWGRNNVQSWLDCSWLLIYTMHQAGLQSPGWDSRDIFQHVSTEKVPVVSDWTSSTLSSIKPGDAIFWNATNEKYNWKTWKIPTIKKGDVDYRIHHICFVKEVSSDGKITIVESSGSQWVVERQIDPNHELTATKHKSELYVGHIDYDGLLAYNAKPDEQLLAAA
jgi:hypothetical protein